MTILCPECGTQNPEGTTYCIECGADLAQATAQPAGPGEPSLSPSPEVSMTSSSEPLRPAAELNGAANARIASPATYLQLERAVLVHLATGERFEVPVTQSSAVIGKPNDEVNVDIDVSHLAGADIVSRIHALVREEEGDFYLEDAGSSNGTFLNGEALKPGARFRRKLQPGDTLALGKNEKIAFRFEITE
ncbi:MAG: FHA domain-containing protein [Aphanocapsa lilacina HA4352-LM1]|jgi:hypothetical protein|nr:FHA domain-containing protein [Aphanocapsa lilacina HA4352-LM1]